MYGPSHPSLVSLLIKTPVCKRVKAPLYTYIYKGAIYNWIFNPFTKRGLDQVRYKVGVGRAEGRTLYSLHAHFIRPELQMGWI